jgi:hypothetical protein
LLLLVALLCRVGAFTAGCGLLLPPLPPRLLRDLGHLHRS